MTDPAPIPYLSANGARDATRAVFIPARASAPTSIMKPMATRSRMKCVLPPVVAPQRTLIEPSTKDNHVKALLAIV